MRIIKNANRADITYELTSNDGKLTNQDKEKLFKLLKKIEEGKSISEKLKKSDYNTRKILLTRVVYKHEGRKDVFTLLHYAKFCKNNQAVKNLLEEAKKHGLFEEVNDKKIISEYLGSNGEPIRTHSAVEDGVVRVKDLYDKNNKKVLNQNITIQVGANAEISTDTRSCGSNEEGKNASTDNTMEESMACSVSRKVKEVMDKCFDIEGQEEIINFYKAKETDTESYKDINKDKEDFQLTFENNERAETEVPLPKEKMVSTQRLIPLDLVLLDDERIGNFNPTTIERAKEKAMSAKRLIPLDPVLLDNEDNENFHLTFENSKKVQNFSIENAVQERNISDSFPFRKCFNSDAAGKEENPSTKTIQQKRVILSSSAGIVLLVGSVVSYIMKIHVIAVIGGIVGLACIGFALYNSFKPNTKLEKVEDPAQPVIVHSYLNTT
ncbi:MULTISPECIES: hypothetical protein [unclassified Wolbachia]|uniref:hypothetical protein n=2 Tax=Wolbachia TaxID=953 RepID=UPI0022268786|nr:MULTISPECIES: hypothetical protein [unclassified Wolbachia]GKS78780.1 hypothetical protein wHma_07870 [Wolbachia pipientis]GKS79068.1 hypothetical protein wHma_10750 [Wolbachia pipientis]